MFSWLGFGGEASTTETKEAENPLGGGCTEKMIFEGVTIQDCLDVIADCEQYPQL